MLLSASPLGIAGLEEQAVGAMVHTLRSPHAEAPRLNVGNAASDADVLSKLRGGLQDFADWSGLLKDAKLLGTDLPVLGNSLGRALNGEAEANLLRRFIEENIGAFNLADIGNTPAIDTLGKLRQRLDGLDTTQGNVKLTTEDGVTRYDVTIAKSLDGSANLDVQAEVLGGMVQLRGDLEMTADIVLHVVFGVDANGFFIDPLNGANATELSISNIRVNGDVEGEGSLGFLGVELTDATLSLDPQIEIAVKLLDPNNDGLVRRNELDRLHQGGSGSATEREPYRRRCGVAGDLCGIRGIGSVIGSGGSRSAARLGRHQRPGYHHGRCQPRCREGSAEFPAT